MSGASRPGSIIDDIYDYIAGDNPAAAGEVYRFIYTYAKQLGANLKFGHEGRVEGTRELVVPRYRRRYTIVYKIADTNVEIIRCGTPAGNGRHLSGARRDPLLLDGITRRADKLAQRTVTPSARLRKRLI